MGLLDAVKKAQDGVEDLISMSIESKINKMFYQRERLEEKRAGLHASAIIATPADYCERAQVLSLFYEMSQGDDIPVWLMRVFAAGNNIHEKLQAMFAREKGLIVEVESRSFSEYWNLYFTPDLVVTKLWKNWKMVGEIKSVNTFQFKKMKSHASAKKQAMLYMHMKGIPHAFILCEDKNTQDIKVFMIEYDWKEVLPFLERLNEIERHRARMERGKKPPQRKEACSGPTSKCAQKCAMKDACWNVGIGRVKLEYDEAT